MTEDADLNGGVEVVITEEAASQPKLLIDASRQFTAYVTAVAATDVADSWREHRDSGGILIDVASGETVASGLSMPHSPRLHEDVLYLLDSGTGQFGKIDVAAGRFEPLSSIGLLLSGFRGRGQTHAHSRG